MCHVHPLVSTSPGLWNWDVSQRVQIWLDQPDKPWFHVSQVSFASLAPGIHFEAATVLLLNLSEWDIHIQIEPAE